MSCRVYRQDKSIKATAAVQKILGEEVPTGYRLEVTHMTVADVTTADKTLEIGYVDQAGEDRVLHAAKGTTRHECHLTGHAWLEAGEAPFGRVTTPTASDVVVFSCHGRLWPRE